MFNHTYPKGTVRAAAFAIALTGFAGLAAGHDLKDHVKMAAAEPQSAEAAPPALWQNLGTLHYAVTTTSPLAQQYFDQGLRLAYGFNHAEALRAFRYAQELDPKCSLCYWGEALVLGPNINAPMSPDAVAPALAAIAKGQGGAPSRAPRSRR